MWSPGRKDVWYLTNEEGDLANMEGVVLVLPSSLEDIFINTKGGGTLVVSRIRVYYGTKMER